MAINLTTLCYRIPALVGSVWLAWACSPDFDALTAGNKFGPVNPFEDTFAGSAGSPAAGGDSGGVMSSGGTQVAGEGGVAAGAAGAVACGSPEICNGIDDDCDEMVDEGCPTGLIWDSVVDRAQLGESEGGGPFSEQCAPSEVLVGLKIRVGGWLDQVAGICEALSVETDEAQTPYAYSVGFQGRRFLPAHPDTATREVEMSCPPNSMLVGLKIGSQTSVEGPSTFLVIRSVWVRCAEPRLSQTDDGWVVTWNDVLDIGPASGTVNGSGERFSSDLVDTVAAATRVHGASGAWIDRVGLGEAVLKVIRR